MWVAKRSVSLSKTRETTKGEYVNGYQNEGCSLRRHDSRHSFFGSGGEGALWTGERTLWNPRPAAAMRGRHGSISPWAKYTRFARHVGVYSGSRTAAFEWIYRIRR